MVYGLIGCCSIIAACGVIIALLWVVVTLTKINTKLCLDKGMHVIVTDPTGVIQTIKIQDRVSEVEQKILEMQKPPMSQAAEEFFTPDAEGLAPMQDAESRNIARGQ